MLLDFISMITSDTMEIAGTVVGLSTLIFTVSICVTSIYYYRSDLKQTKLTFKRPSYLTLDHLIFLRS